NEYMISNPIYEIYYGYQPFLYWQGNTAHTLLKQLAELIPLTEIENIWITGCRDQSEYSCWAMEDKKYTIILDTSSLQPNLVRWIHTHKPKEYPKFCYIDKYLFQLTCKSAKLDLLWTKRVTCCRASPRSHRELIAISSSCRTATAQLAQLAWYDAVQHHHTTTNSCADDHESLGPVGICELLSRCWVCYHPRRGGGPTDNVQQRRFYDSLRYAPPGKAYVAPLGIWTVLEKMGTSSLEFIK
ncbi:hypothetical protein LCGC14_2975030, partial [marine sediment metagenome]